MTCLASSYATIIGRNAEALKLRERPWQLRSPNFGMTTPTCF